MACGKTTLGRALEASAGMPFVDLDAAIEAAAGRSVAEIFASDGEEAFRALEAAELARIIDRYAGQTAVVACGGGTPCRPDAMRAMLGAGTVIWLRADPDVTLRRIVEAAGTRPRVAGMSAGEIRRFMSDEARRRDPVYARAHAVFDSSRLDTPEEIAGSVGRFLSQFINKPQS